MRNLPTELTYSLGLTIYLRIGNAILENAASKASTHMTNDCMARCAGPTNGPITI